MSIVSNLNITPSKLQLCPKTFTCAEYDGWEPSKRCLTGYGVNCKQNTPVTCSQCGHFSRVTKCKIGYSTYAKSKACNQAVSLTLAYKRGI